MNEHERQQLIKKATAASRSASVDHGWDSAKARNARQQLLEVERATAAEMGLPYVSPVDLGAPLGSRRTDAVSADRHENVPCLLPSRRRPGIRQAQPRRAGWDQEYGVGVVEFRHVVAIKMGSPNDEVLRGHPLYGYGLEGYGAQVVSNSPWISELADVNRVHPQFRQENWAPARHYLLPFHDETAECVAHDATSWTELRPMDEVVASSPPPHCGRPDSNVALSEPKVDAFGSMICLGGVCAPG